MNHQRYYFIMRQIIGLLIVASLAGPVLADPPEAINLRKTVVVEVVAKTKGAVVNISTTKIVHVRVNPFGNDPFFQQFNFGTTDVPANSLGSGFIVHPDGYVITNNHVIDQAREITVELADGRKLPAQLISADPQADLAVLKISDKQPFPIVEMGDSDDLMIGEPANAIGNPLGYSHSVSTGIVSALHRDLQSEGKSAMKDLIQTDAAINPGNSGGPLLNAYGQVIGINTAIRSDAQNIGFAIPVNRLRDLIPELMNPTQVNKVEMPVKLSERRKISEPAVISVEIVTDGSPTQVIKEIDGHHPLNIVDAYDLLLQSKVGDQLSLEFADGSTQSMTLKAAPLPDAVTQAKEKLGITVEQVTAALQQKYGLSVDHGLFVSSVANDSLAAKAGMQPGDVLVQLGQFRVNTLDDLSGLFQHWPTSGQVIFFIYRNDEQGYGQFDLGPQ